MPPVHQTPLPLIDDALRKNIEDHLPHLNFNSDKDREFIYALVDLIREMDAEIESQKRYIRKLLRRPPTQKVKMSPDEQAKGLVRG